MSLLSQTKMFSKTDSNNRNRSRSWFFTWNNYQNEHIDYLLKELSLFPDTLYIFQQECGKSGTPHLQGVIKWKLQKDFNWVRKKFFLSLANINKTRGWKAAVAYCCKAESRIEEPYTNIKDLVIPKALVDPLKGLKLYEYQQEVLDYIGLDPDPRKIYWYWEEDGNTGKSALCKHLALRYYALVISGKATDIKYAIASMKLKPEIIIIDIPRSYQKFISYSTIEEIKNGMFFSGKYEGQMVIFNTPHIFCFANSEPDYEMMSEDRWRISNIIL